MIRVAVASMVSLLALPAAAHAALPPAKPPAKTLAGAKITWPLKAAETTLAPNSTLKVKIDSPRRRATVSLLRVDARGIPTRTVARRTLRSGTFTARLPLGLGEHYQLRVVVAGKRRWSWIATPAPAPVAEPTPVLPPAPAPTPLPEPLSLACDTPWWSNFELDATTVTPGQPFTYRLRFVPVGGKDLGASWQRRDGATWVEYAAGLVEPPSSQPLTDPLVHHAQLPGDAPAGTYRLRQTMDDAGTPCDYLPQTMASDAITIP